MFLPRKGFLASPIIIILALITIAVVSALILQAKFFSEDKTASPPPVAQAPQKTSPTPSSDSAEITDWETYTSNDWKWTLKYPEKWRVVVGGSSCARDGGGEGTKDHICFFSEDFSAEEMKGFGFQVYSKVFDPEFMRTDCGNLSKELCEELTIAGQKARKFKNSEEYHLTPSNEEYNFSLNNSYIAIQFNYLSCESQNIDGCRKKENIYILINQILSTFKFLD